MEDFIHTFIRAAFLAFCGCSILAALAGLFWFTAGLFIKMGDAMLRNGLRIVRISNWRYWSARMEREGITAMRKFYVERVTQRKPHTASEFVDVEREADQKESSELDQKPKDVP